MTLYLVPMSHDEGRLSRGRTTSLISYAVMFSGQKLGTVGSYLRRVDRTPMARTRSDGAPRKAWSADLPNGGRSISRLDSRREAIAQLLERVGGFDSDEADRLARTARVTLK